MGMVYRPTTACSTRRSPSRSCAPDVARDPEMARRFRSEIKLARKVRHRTSAASTSTARTAACATSRWSYMRGRGPEAAAARAGRAADRRGVRVAIQIADGPAAPSTTSGIIHRDLKTPNIMRDARARPAHGLRHRQGLAARAARAATATGHVVGTPEYMSPEQARGEKLDFRSDIYALGIVIFELFTGRVPFRGETPIATILKHLQEPPPLDGPEAARIPPRGARGPAQGAGQGPERALRDGGRAGPGAARRAAGERRRPAARRSRPPDAPSAPSPTTYIPTPVPPPSAHRASAARAAEPTTFRRQPRRRRRRPSRRCHPTIRLRAPAPPRRPARAPVRPDTPPLAPSSAPSRTGL